MLRNLLLEGEGKPGRIEPTRIMGKLKLMTGVWSAVAGALLAIFVSGSAHAYKGTIACGTFAIGGINLRCAGPDANMSPAPLPPGVTSSAGWPGWAVLSVAEGKGVVFQGGTTGDGGTATMPFGNVGLYGTNKANVTGTAVIQGNVFHTDGWYGSAATQFEKGGSDNILSETSPGDWTHITGGFKGGFLTNKLLWFAKQDAIAAAAQASADTAAHVISGSGLAFNHTGDYKLTSDLVIDAVADGTNYINIGKNLDLNGFTLTLNRNGKNDVDFILNVGNDLKASADKTSRITLDGGLLWSDLLINVEHNSTYVADTTLPTLTDFRGVGVLIGSGDMQFDRTQWQGEIIGLSGKMEFKNGSQVTNPGDVISVVTFIPEPGSFALLLVGFLAAAFSLCYGRARGDIGFRRVRI